MATGCSSVWPAPIWAVAILIGARSSNALMLSIEVVVVAAMAAIGIVVMIVSLRASYREQRKHWKSTLVLETLSVNMI